MAEMLIPGQAANCRRMEPDSRRAAHLAVDDRRQHLALESAHRCRLAKVQVAVQGTGRLCDAKIDGKYGLSNTGGLTAVSVRLPTVIVEVRMAQPDPPEVGGIDEPV